MHAWVKATESANKSRRKWVCATITQGTNCATTRRCDYTSSVHLLVDPYSSSGGTGALSASRANM
eukprot:363664-Chlamydomonas_euryale.AAC.13